MNTNSAACSASNSPALVQPLRDVVASVSLAGGFGVFGAGSRTPEQLETELAWIDARVARKTLRRRSTDPREPLGPHRRRLRTQGDLTARIPDRHRMFVDDLLRPHDVDSARGSQAREGSRSSAAVSDRDRRETVGRGLSSPHPADRQRAGACRRPRCLERARDRGIPCAALVGAREHAMSAGRGRGRHPRRARHRSRRPLRRGFHAGPGP